MHGRSWLCCAAVALLLLGHAAAAPAAAGGDKSAASISRNTIPSAGTVTLANGNGDVSRTGPCKDAISQFCKDTGAGEGRLAQCLTKRIVEQSKGNVAGRKVGDKCKEHLLQFKIDRSANINKDLPLAKACKDAVAKHCKDKSDEKEPASVLACLREKKNDLPQACKDQVFRTQHEAMLDFRTDYKLFATCKDDVKNLCSDADPGQEIECLGLRRRDVSWDCQHQLFRAEKEAGDDIRLSVRLFNKCYENYQRHCKHVEPGHMAVQECLEDHLDEPKFASDCKEELDAVIARRVADFRLNTVLRDACAGDLQEHCAATLQDMDSDDKVRNRAMNCLQQYVEELSDTKCRDEVHRMTTRAARDIRFDQVLADACLDDRTQYCSDVKPGSARVIRCLQDHRGSLQQQCAAALFDHEVRMAESIDFQYPMKKACAWEMKLYCKDVPSGHARVIRCLQENLEQPDMSQECKDEVARSTRQQGRDYRLNWRLNDACGSDIARLCSHQCTAGGHVPCGGLVLRCLQCAAGGHVPCSGPVLTCLQDNQDNITDQACQDEVFYYELMEVSDFRNDVILAEACRSDVEAYCKDVQPGEGRVHTCLRQNKEKISDRCRKEEMKLQQLEYRDIRLRPKLNKLCSEEKAAFCSQVKPGRARVVKCLIENMAHPNFGEECHEELQKREEAMSSDYRYDVAVAGGCSVDIEQFCAEEKGQLRGTAAVLKCLVKNFQQEAEYCQQEMSRAVRLALWDYKVGAPLTTVCDADVQDKCPAGPQAKSGSAFTIGAVGRCLSKAMAQGEVLRPGCRQLVLVAAPKNMREYFQAGDTSAVLQRALDMQKAAGLDGVLLNPDAESTAGTVTVTGWLALACIISLVVVTVGGAFLLVRRFTGAAKPHTLHVKSGDA